MEVKIDLLSCDGEFYSRDVAEYLDNLPRRKGPKSYLIRGSYSRKKDYPGRIDGPGFPYEILAGTKNAYRVEGYLIEQDTPQGKEIIFFISSTYYRIHYSEIKRIYKRRFRIENIFRHTRNCKIISSSDNFARRIILWAFSHFVELLWEIFRISHQDNSVESEDEYHYRYGLRQKRFLRILLDHIKFKIRSIAKSRSQADYTLKCDCKCHSSKDG